MKLKLLIENKKDVRTKNLILFCFNNNISFEKLDRKNVSNTIVYEYKDYIPVGDFYFVHEYFTAYDMSSTDFLKYYNILETVYTETFNKFKANVIICIWNTLKETKTELFVNKLTR